MTYETALMDVAFSPDGKYVAMATVNHARLFELATGQEIHRMVHEHPTSYWIRRVAFTGDGNYLAIASEDGTARVPCLHITLNRRLHPLAPG